MITSEALVNRAPFSTNTFGDIFFCNARKDQDGNPLLGKPIAYTTHSRGAQMYVCVHVSKGHFYGVPEVVGANGA